MLTESVSPIMQKNVVVLSPPPVFFIKSISEQGYTLSTAMADLIDNSIAAGATRVEILINKTTEPLRIYIADNGNGMDAEALTMNMRFPSADIDAERTSNDMGRFGLGLKTASFSQSRKFSVISRPVKGEYEGRTWDVKYLKQTNDWTLIIESDIAVYEYIEAFRQTSSIFHSKQTDFEPNTLIIWDELYKLNKYKSENALEEDLEELRSHLGLVFHRFLQKKKLPLEIRLNNVMVQPFDPFPVGTPGIQTVSEVFWQTGNDYIKFQGIILPKISEQESRENGSVWATNSQTLEELQGIYVYRNERLINYGGWLRTIPKTASLQFGRIRIDVTNVNDHTLQLNVAKSSLKIPLSLKKAMIEMITYVAGQANKEYRDRVASGIIRQNASSQGLSLIIKEITGGGPVLKINPRFEIFRQLSDNLTGDNKNYFKILIHLIEQKLNQIWSEDSNNMECYLENGEDEKQKIIIIKKFYETLDYSWEEIRQLLTENFGSKQEILSFIDSLKK
jgi:hypothetical protein